MTWGFPCTDISMAGKQKGFKDEHGNLTRSGLYYEGLRMLQCKKPKYSIIENVKALTQKKFKAEFEQILQDLKLAGYNNYRKVLNAKDFGIPQNRERVFIISIRKDMDNGEFQFPEGFDNGLRLKDLLEDIVDEKYYISQDKTDKLIEQLKNKEISNTVRAGGRGSLDRHSWDLVCINAEESLQSAMQINRGEVKIKEDDICSCIDANYWKGLDNHAARTGIMQVGMLDIKGNEQVRRVYDPEGLSPTLNTMGGGNRQPKIIEDFYANREIREYEDYSPTLRADRQGLKVIHGCSTRTRSYMGQPEQLEIRDDGLSNSITTVQKDAMITNYYRIRKLTPLECLRLMGFDDKDYYILKENGISDTQIYKMAGNSIVVQVLEALSEQLFIQISIN